MRYLQPGNLCDDYETGIAAVNERLHADGVNIDVEIIRIPWDAYAEKLNLMLTSGEPCELLHIMQDVRNISSIAGIGAIMSLEGLIDDYPGLIGRFTDLEWQGSLFNNQRYAVPNYWTSFDAVMGYISVRIDTMQKVGYDEFPAYSTENLIDLMKKSQADILDETGIRPYSWTHQIQDTSHWLHRTYDTYPFYVENSLGLVQSFQDGRIESFYESEEFKNDANFYYKLFQDGLINPDILSLDRQNMYDQAELGAFLPSQTFDANLQVTIKKNTGMDTITERRYMFPEKPDMMYTYVQNLNAISSTSKNPHSGLQFLDWLYESLEHHDLFHYGIEGTHYTAYGDDKIEHVKNEAGQAIYIMDTWMSGYLPLIRFGIDATEAYIADTQYKSTNYVVSPIAGFIFDSGPVTSELTNLQIELIASIYPIKFGMVSYEENIGPAIERLKAAGLDAYMTEYRRQFEQYLSERPDLLEFCKGTTK
jgi:putative aldouronate transport system substrate-binding protein